MRLFFGIFANGGFWFIVSRERYYGETETRATWSAEKTVKNIRRAMWKHHAIEEKIRIVLEGWRGEYSIAELCRR